MLGPDDLRKGDEVIVSHMEHHANIVPWQMLRERRASAPRSCRSMTSGELLLDEYESCWAREDEAGRHHPHVQRAGHDQPGQGYRPAGPCRAFRCCWTGPGCHAPAADVQDLDVRLLRFSGHKLYGPTGIGVLYGKAEFLEACRRTRAAAT